MERPEQEILKLSAVAAGVLGATGVVAGALGAHALADRLAEAGRLGVWETAVLYQLVHAVALLALGGWAGRLRAGRAIAVFWLGGTILFSGSLYGLSLGGPGWLGPVTPVGGLLLILGWLLLATGGRSLIRS
ncbi:MAG: DUF423 domain-containing protein [Opitutales bacterium]